MIDARTAPYAGLLLRMVLGAFFAVHSLNKLLVFTPAGVVSFFGKLGLPPSLAYAVIAAEAVGAVCLILGVYARVVALALLPILFGAIGFVHGANGWFFAAAGGGWEYLAFVISMSLGVALLGEGAHALRPTPPLDLLGRSRGNALARS